MKKTALILVLALAAGACRTISLDYQQGLKAELNKNYDEAIQAYQKAALSHPNDSAYRLALFRARASATLYYLQQARVLVAQNKRKEAEVNYRKALLFDPQNFQASRELQALLAPPEKKDKNGDRLEGPVRLKGTAEPLNLSFRNEVSLRSIFQTLGRLAGVNFLYDDQFRDTNLAIDLTGKDLQQAVNFLCVASKNFSRVIDERTVIIVPDNVQKRMQYELNAIKTFYLSNIDAADVQMRLTSLVKTQYKVPTIQVDKNLNTVTIRDTPQAVALAEKVLRQWDKAKGEVLIDIEIMEVDRIREKNLGIDLSQGALAGALIPESGVDSDGFFKLQGLDLGNLANYQITVPTAIAAILATDSDTKIIAQPKIRGVAGEKLEYIVGQKVPIVNSTFAAIAAGGLSTQPIVNYNLQDIGITIKMTPRVHLEGEVTLEIELEVSSIAGEGTAGIPIIANRSVKNTVRLKDGETNLLAGLLRDEERRSVGGVTGLKDLPLLGQLFSATKKQIEQTDLVMTITPHIIRPLEISEEDLKPLWVDPDNLSGVTGAGGAVRPDLRDEAGAGGEPAEPEDTGASSVFLSPASFEAPRGREFRMNVELQSDAEIGNASLVLSFDPRILQLKDVLEGTGLRQMGDKAPFSKYISGGTCTIGFSTPPGGRGFKGRGVVAVLVFSSLEPGQASLGFTSATAGGPMGQAILLQTGEASVNVR